MRLERRGDVVEDGQMGVEAKFSKTIAISLACGGLSLIRSSSFRTPASPGPVNVLIMPSVDAANISYNLLRMAAGHGLTVGGILLGPAKPAHIVTP